MRIKGAGGFKRAHAFRVDEDEGVATFVCSVDKRLVDKRLVEIHRVDLSRDSRSLEDFFPGLNLSWNGMNSHYL